METSNIKSYAPKARLEFMDAVAKRLNTFGISVNKKGELRVTEAITQGSVLQIGDNNFDSSLAQRRQRLVERSQQLGYEQLVEQVAYTWFNRLCAIRYMEIHDYLGHGFRVLSHPSGEKQFEIIDHAQDAAEELGLDRNHVIDLKLAGNKNEELYRELLLGQCHKLHEAMPFLFESLNDETELLLPDSLTRTDSILRGLVDSVPEEDWQQVEVIGWLYQFYISEKKDQVIGKVVKTEDIPAATQLFTPNWIVKYMVQNSLGAQWLATYPDSPLKAQMEYYIEPAEQTDAVNAQLKEITPTELNPEELTLIDPASGSGHILVEAYDLFKAIYLERGYRQRDIAQLILEKNLFGLDIDQRAAQLTGFALMMKGREDDRRLFGRGIKLNIMAMHSSSGLEPSTLGQGINLASYHLNADDLTEFINLFEHAHDFGSLIQIPLHLANKLPALNELVQNETHNPDLFVSEALQQLTPLVDQANILAAQYDSVVENPPYMGRKYINPVLKKFASLHYESSQADLYAMFIERNIAFCRRGCNIAMICMDSWLHGEDFLETRRNFVDQGTFVSMCHLGPHAFPEISGEVVQVASFIASVGIANSYECTFIDLVDEKNSEAKEQKFLCSDGRYVVATSVFSELPREVFTAYRASPSVISVFANSVPMKSIAEAFTGLQTGDNPRFIRNWFELSFNSIAFECVGHDEAQASRKRWFPYVKGSDYRKWYGNQLCVVDWKDNGTAIRRHSSSTVRNANHYFKVGIAYNNIAKRFSARHVDSGFIFDQKNSMFFANSPENLPLTLGLLHSDAITPFLQILSPKDFGPGALKIMPVPKSLLQKSKVGVSVASLIESHRQDWDSSEQSWSFQTNPLLKVSNEPKLPLASIYNSWTTKNQDIIGKVKCLEKENNRIFIEAYGLSDELTPEVPIEQITLTVNPAYRYGIKGTEQERNARFRSDTMTELVSYTIGCMMGRYSLDQEGLVYAHAGNAGFDASLYRTFPADSDGIVPIMDDEWFKDDACNRVVEFVKTVWGEDNLTENLQFIADSLCLDAIKPKNSESAAATIRRYLSTKFYKDHMQTYKNRPIYWLFSSGKEKAFECLVYLHRYNESTLSRMRTEYVTPLLGKYEAYAEQLDKQIDMAESTQDKKRLERELKSMDKKQSELRGFDDKLKHYADMRISIELDDGVKENYGKFGDLLAEVKKITGEKPEIINAN